MKKYEINSPIRALQSGILCEWSRMISVGLNMQCDEGSLFLYFVDHASVMILHKWPMWHTILFHVFIYFISLHVSSNLMLIIRRINCINTTSGICHPVLVTVSHAGPAGLAHKTVIDREWHIPVVVLIQFILLMMSTRLLETCRELK